MLSSHRPMFLDMISALILLNTPLLICKQAKNLQENNYDEKGVTMELSTGIKKEERQGVAALLNKLLADEFVLYTKTLNYHWNVVGMNFNDLHGLFNKQYLELLEVFDSIAERVRALGYPAAGTLSEFLQLTRLKEEPKTKLTDKEMIKNLLDDYETIIRTMRVDLQTCADEYNDMGTNNMLTDLITKHEKTAWMLRSYLEK